MKRILLSFGGTRIPPSEFLVFPFGEISTRKGKFLLTQESAETVMKLYEEHGVDIMFDYEHGGLSPHMNPGGKAPGAGSCKLALRSDGIWLTQIRWTDTAAEHLRQGEYRYLSPAFNINPKTGEIIELINVALTNLPATDNIKPLVAASRLASRQISATDQPVPLGRSKTMKAHPMSKHLKEHMAKHEMSHKDLATKCGVSADRMKKLSDGHPPTQEEMKKCGKFLGLSDEKMKKLSEHKADEEASEHEADEAAAREKPDEENSLNGLDPEAEAVPYQANVDDMMTVTESDEVVVPHAGDEADENRGVKSSRVDDDVEAELQTLTSGTEDTVQLSRETLALITGEKDPKKQGKALAGLVKKARSFDADHETVQQLSRDNEARERRELVALGRKDKKLTPESEKFWLTQPVGTFREWLKSAAPVAALEGGDLQELTPSNFGGITLTREELEVCNILGDDPTALAAHKKDMAGAEPFRMSRKVQQRMLNSFLGRDTNAEA